MKRIFSILKQSAIATTVSVIVSFQMQARSRVIRFVKRISVPLATQQNQHLKPFFKLEIINKPIAF